MNEIAAQPFVSATRGILDFRGVLSDILADFQNRRGRQLRVSVGTDSEEIGAFVKYVTVVHVWRVGRGARAYRIEAFEPFTSASRRGTSRFRERLWREVLLTATLAQELRSALREALGDAFLDDLEVHADIGLQGGSSVMIREIIVMLKGYGFADELIKLKPEAYAASTVADRYI